MSIRSREPLIPAPIASMILPSSMSVTRDLNKQGSDDLQRIDKALQRHMQTLLDAQNSLLFPESPSGADEASEREDDSNSGLGLINSRALEPSRGRHGRGKTGLRDIREDIRKTMLKLLNVKTQQVERSDAKLEAIRHQTARIDHWNEKEHELKDTIDSLRQDGRDQQARKLLDEENALQEQIVAMERQLSDLRATKQALHRQRMGIQNAMQAKASSYEGSLAILVKEKLDFLKRPPPELTNVLDAIDAPVMKTSAGSRTLAQVSGALKDAEMSESQRRQASNAEISALTGGIEYWKNTVRRIEDVEAVVSKGLLKLRPAKAESPHATRDTELLLSTLNDGIEDLQDLLDQAEGQGWSLLVCCIGAELEAIKRGSEVIQHTLQMVQEQKLQELDARQARGSTTTQRHTTYQSDDTDPQRLLLSTNDVDSD